jgi:hypothetical protein
VRRDVGRDHAARSDERPLPHRDPTEDDGAAADGCPRADARGDRRPVGAGLGRTVRIDRLGIAVVDEDDVMADETLVFDGDALADDERS